MGVWCTVVHLMANSTATISTTAKKFEPLGAEKCCLTLLLIQYCHLLLQGQRGMGILCFFIRCMFKMKVGAFFFLICKFLLWSWIRLLTQVPSLRYNLVSFKFYSLATYTSPFVGMVFPKLVWCSPYFVGSCVAILCSEYFCPYVMGAFITHTKI